MTDSEWLAAELRLAKAKRNWLLSLGCLASFLACCGMILWPVIPGARYAKTVFARSNVKQLDVAALMYSNDADDRLPTARIWMDLILPFVRNDKRVFHSPSLSDSRQYGFAFRRSLSSVRTDDVEFPAKMALIFDSIDTRWNANGELALLPRPGRYGTVNVVGFVDGNVKMIPAGPLGPALK